MLSLIIVVYFVFLFDVVEFGSVCDDLPLSGAGLWDFASDSLQG